MPSHDSGSGYLQSLTKENVEVVISEAVRFWENGVVDEAGKEHAVDVIICSTGFDTSFLSGMNAPVATGSG